MKIKLLLLIFVVLPLSGCFNRIAVKSLGGIMETGFQVLNEEEDLKIAESSIASNLKLLETIIKNEPENKEYLLLACIGYSSYSLGFIEDDSPERAGFFYLRSKGYGMKILNMNEKFARAEKESVEGFVKALESFSADDIPFLFWTAMSWGSYVSLNLTDPSAIADLPKVEEMMKFVVARKPDYFYGGAHFFLGTLYGSRPKLLGGDPELSRLHFDECIKISDEKFLLPYVYLARTYAVQTQDAVLFEECLDKVDSASIDALPQARLSNAIAKKKAKLLREKIDELF